MGWLDGLMAWTHINRPFSPPPPNPSTESIDRPTHHPSTIRPINEPIPTYATH